MQSNMWKLEKTFHCLGMGVDIMAVPDSINSCPSHINPCVPPLSFFALVDISYTTDAPLGATTFPPSADDAKAKKLKSRQRSIGNKNSPRLKQPLTFSISSRSIIRPTYFWISHMHPYCGCVNCD